jgi:cyclopropane fatty-acyl-phospholipid synthase-like methyltransferase
MTESEQQLLAAQLKHPHGAMANTIAQRMNKGNALMYQLTIAQLELKNNDRVLEIGMANGYFIRQIVEQASGIHYTGLDISEEMVQEATQNHADLVQSEQVRLVCDDVMNVQQWNQSFDKIFSINTLYFWEHPNEVLQQLKKCLSPQGTLLLCIRPKEVMQQYPFVKYGFTMYSTDELLQLLHKNGYKVLEIKNEKEPDQEIFGQTYHVESVLVKCSV